MLAQDLKATAILLLSVMSIAHLGLFIPWGLYNDRIGAWIWLWSALFLLGITGFGISICLLTKQNCLRVITNTCIIVACLFVGLAWNDWNFHKYAPARADPAEIYRGMLRYGIPGTLAGYCITLLRTARKKTKNRLQFGGQQF